jgi:hypothetical protein
MKEMVKRLVEACPGLQLGYFNQPKGFLKSLQ